MTLLLTLEKRVQELHRVHDFAANFGETCASATLLNGGLNMCRGDFGAKLRVDM